MIQTLVTGGTGFVGSSIVRQLVSQKETVHVLTRNPSTVPQNRRVPGAYYIEGDVMDPTSLEKAMQGCDAIVHAVQFPGAPFENPRKGWTYDRIDGQGTENLCQVAKAQNIERLIYISGAGAGQARTEPWFQAKDRAEKAIQSVHTSWTIFRPSMIYGPQDQSLNRMKLMSLLPLVFPIIGHGQQRLAPVFIEDVAKAVGYSLNRTKTHEKVFDLGGPEVFTFDETIQVMLKVLGKKRLLIHIPPRIIKMVADIINTIPLKPFITSDGIDFILMNPKINPSEAHDFFDFVFTPLETGLSKYL